MSIINNFEVDAVAVCYLLLRLTLSFGFSNLFSDSKSWEKNRDKTRKFPKCEETKTFAIKTQTMKKCTIKFIKKKKKKKKNARKETISISDFDY